MFVRLIDSGFAAVRVVRSIVDRLRSVMRSVPRSRSYLLMGVVMAVGTPVGLLMVRAVATEQRAVACTGGDEFAVLLPETSLAEASALSQRILAEVARLGDASRGKLAISIGSAELDAAADLEPEDMLAAADAAVYRAKAAGGGHAAVAQAEPVISSPAPSVPAQAVTGFESHARSGAGLWF